MDTSFAVVIASKGRPTILTETVESLENQSRPVADVFLAVTSDEDVEERCVQRPEVTVLMCPVGLTRQRNTAIEQTAERFDILIFLDDDMQLHREYIASALRLLSERPGIVAFSGRLLRNGQITRDEARRLVESYQPESHDRMPELRTRGRHWILHGCNMVLRTSVLQQVRFDENLPLYSFAEDYDISVRLSSFGLVGKYRGCAAVHLETPSGRVSETRLGYSTLANNWYFLGKRVTHCRSVSLGYLRFALRIALFEPLRNAGSALLGKRGRAERLRGNILALRDILGGTCTPGRIKELD